MYEIRHLRLPGDVLSDGVMAYVNGVLFHIMYLVVALNIKLPNLRHYYSCCWNPAAKVLLMHYKPPTQTAHEVLAPETK